MIQISNSFIHEILNIDRNLIMILLPFCSKEDDILKTVMLYYENYIRQFANDSKIFALSLKFLNFPIKTSDRICPRPSGIAVFEDWCFSSFSVDFIRLPRSSAAIHDLDRHESISLCFLQFPGALYNELLPRAFRGRLLHALNDSHSFSPHDFQDWDRTNAISSGFIVAKEWME